MNKFLLSASIIAVCSSQVWATKQIVDEEVALTVNQQNVINQLKNIKNTNGILIVDESDIRDRALQRVLHEQGGGGIDAQNDIDTFTREGVIATLNGMAKNSDVDFPNDVQGRKLTRNVKKHNKLSLGFKNKTPLVYPTSENDRTLEDAFLPKNYGNSYSGASAINKALYQEIDAYVRSVRNISNDQKNLLYRYLEPLFFVVQESVGKLMKGLVNTRGWHMSREDLLTEVMRQAKFHVDMISSANIAGLNSTEVENALTRSLFNQVFAILPDLNKDLGVYYGKTYKLGANIHGDPSLLHPHAGLAYPIFTESHRLAEGWNLPQGYRSSPDLDKQWKRVNHFLLEESSNTQERNNLKILLDPVAHQSLSFLQNLRVDVSNLNLADYGSFMGLSNDEPHDGRFLQSLSPYEKF